MMKIDDATKRRLVYAKTLYMHGHEHASYGTEFDRMIAIHHFDNAVELLLKCIATNYNISFKSLHVSFPDLWSAVDQKHKASEKSELPKNTEMRQLHDFRCDVQHWGISPFSLEIVNRFDVYTLDFITYVFEKIFKLDYNQLFMSFLVEDETLRKILTTAEKAFGTKNYAETIRFADAAFNRALTQQREEFGLYIPAEKEKLLEEITEPIFVLTLGIDYREYSKYEKLAPRAIWYEEEQRISYSQPLFGEDERYTKENALFCFNFVLNTILRWRL